jgi:hypothetical protein
MLVYRDFAVQDEARTYRLGQPWVCDLRQLDQHLVLAPRLRQPRGDVSCTAGHRERPLRMDGERPELTVIHPQRLDQGKGVVDGEDIGARQLA